MAGLPHMQGSKAIPRLLERIRHDPPPAKVTKAHITRWQFSNEQAIISVLRATGFTSKNDVPAQLWLDYQDESLAPTALARAVRGTYAVLFEAYGDADKQSDAALGKVLKIHTKFSNADIQRTVATFRRLCESAEFDTQVKPPKRIPIPVDQEISIAELDTWVGHRTKLMSRDGLHTLVDSTDYPSKKRLLEAIHCVTSDLLTQAHVTAWNAFMECALRRLHGNEPRAGWMPDRQILDALLERGLCTTSEFEWLVPLLQRRHDCAHVTDFVPDRDQALWYIGAIVEQIESLEAQSTA